MEVNVIQTIPLTINNNIEIEGNQISENDFREFDNNKVSNMFGENSIVYFVNEMAGFEIWTSYELKEYENTIYYELKTKLNLD